ncbi:MAG TPA: acyl-CoA desaturase, partial [Micrococcaceae bacterium]
MNSYGALLREVRAAGLMERRRGFYAATFAVLLAVLAACWVALALLDPSWYLLLLAAVLGVVFTQFAFLAHEASHHQIFASAR